MIGTKEHPFVMDNLSELDRFDQAIADLLHETALLAFIQIGEGGNIYQVLANRRGRGFSTLKISGIQDDKADALHRKLEDLLLAP